MELTPADGELFHLAKVGLGCLGVVAEVTMKCIPSHRLVEHTYVLTRAEAKDQINSLLKQHKHIRYMWIPYEDAVVVVTNDPHYKVPVEDAAKGATKKRSAMRQSSFTKTETEKAERLRPFTHLLVKLTAGTDTPYTEESIEGMGFGELRDALLAIDPLNSEHVKLCNHAEAEFWRLNEGFQTKPSDQLLQFDCGGQQWVWEVCFQTGRYETNNGNDMEFMEQLLEGIEKNKIAAHSPIEQRWSASSSSLMSPASGPAGGLFSWVGIIMYLPSEDEKQRHDITKSFKGEYCDLLREVGKDVGAVSHWAKIEMPTDSQHQGALWWSMLQKYPVSLFAAARKRLDPNNILGNDLIDAVLGANPKE
eukprot:scaffold34601_cov40-Attheya_sp.AAC.2